MKSRPRFFWWTLLVLWPALAFWNQFLITPAGGIPWWAGLGAALAVLCWHYTTGQNFRCRAVLGALLLVWLAGSGLLAMLDGASSLSLALGSDRWVLARQSLAAGLWAFCLVGWLRALSWRFPAGAALELAAAGGIFVLALEAHRDGYINRPFQMVDPLWLRGLDPSALFIAVGSLALVAVCTLAANRPGNRRPWWDLPLMLMLLLVLYLVVPANQVKQIFERFGMGKPGGKENRLTPEGGLKTPGPASPGSGGTPDPKKKPDPNEPSFEDSTRQKPVPVAVVVFQDDYDPPSGAYYFRQTSESQFNGIKLVHSNDDRFDRDNAQGFPTRFYDKDARPEELGMRLPALSRFNFQPLRTRVALLDQHPRPFGIVNPQHYWAVSNPDPDRFQKAYDVESLVLNGDYRSLIPNRAGDQSWAADEWSHYLEGPNDRRYKELADSILAGVPEAGRDSTLIRAVYIKKWLDDNCTYSLKSPSANAADPVSDYLFGQRIGYCVFTSHSACYLFRAAGIPARISDGYMVPAQQRGGGSSLLIRSSDAHSWPEIYLQDVGWLDLDIAPKKNLEPEKEQVDNNLQQMMGDMARKDKKDRRPEENRPSIDLHQLVLFMLRSLLSGLFGAIILAWLALLLWKLWRRRAPFWSTGREQARLAYLCVLDILSEQGVRRQRDESCEEFARRMSEEMPALLALARVHLRVRLGPPDSPPQREVMPLLKECLSQLRRRRLTGWRRYLGWLDPTSPLRVR
ncbi:MAG: transglutaminase-like domain-containing protein [Vulcanimicrobiota bacterium]